MKPFRFQKFSLEQSSQVFRIGTDGVLLGAMCNVENANQILEIGTGTGIISLMLAQRNPDAEIFAIDIDENASKLAELNFKNSPFNLRLQSLHKNLKELECKKKFDLIVSNPPYFSENNSVKDVSARQQIELNYNDLVLKSSKLLKENGKLSVIIPFEDGENFKKLALENKLQLVRKIKIFGIQNSKPKRLILEFSSEIQTIEESEFTIEKSPRVYSDEYLKLTKDFHLFKH